MQNKFHQQKMMTVFFLEVVGGLSDKGTVYGLGNIARLFHTTPIYSSRRKSELRSKLPFWVLWISYTYVLSFVCLLYTSDAADE